MFKKYLTLSCLFLLILSACKEDRIGIKENDGVAPAPIANASVENLSGKAKITYTLPSDKDLMYVMAEYVNKKGERLEYKSSLYANYITVEGFGDESEYSVNLYAVDRAQNRSKPVTVKVVPLKPPVVLVYESLSVAAAFGGIKIDFLNIQKANVVIDVLTDSLGRWIPVTPPSAFYTSSVGGDFTVRGYGPVERKFAIVIKDKFGNRSDTLKVSRTPYDEKPLNMAQFNELKLPTDVSTYSGSYVLRNVWDDKVADNGYHTSLSGDIPHWFTIDMGVVAKLSRFKLWQRGIVQNPDYKYNRGNPELIEVWGSLQKPAADGSWGGWTKLADYVSVKPSGNPLGSFNSDDAAHAEAGEDCIFPLDSPPVRYLRFKVIKTWGNTNYTHFNEIKFWGSY